MTTRTKKTKRTTKNTYTPRPPDCKRYLVFVTAVCPVDIPQDVALRERDLGLLDHEIWERFESQYRCGIELEAIRQTTFINDNGAGEWTPIYRLPPAAREGRPLNSQEMRRSARAVLSGGADDIYEPDPPGVLPL